MAAKTSQHVGNAVKQYTHVKALDPIIFPDSRVYFLGSMPSPKSMAFTLAILKIGSGA